MERMKRERSRKWARTLDGVVAERTALLLLLAAKPRASIRQSVWQLEAIEVP